MYYGMGHFPDIDITRINAIRRKYDPTADIVDPHITVMFPVPDEISEEALAQHLTQVLKSWRPFPIRIGGFCKSWDHWLFLTLREGNDDVIRLNRAIYTGILKPYHREDIPFIPHIGLGLFVMEDAEYDMLNPQQVAFDEVRYEAALREAEAARLEYDCLLDRLDLVVLTDHPLQVQRHRAFALGENG